MNKTLLIVFIHGFKGGEDTFGDFPRHFRTLVSRALPAVRVTSAVYPKYETRGDLKECVSTFREWLQNTVIDLEVANHTASPTVDPSVHVFLVGHSMGGIVAAETLLVLASEQPLPPKPAANIATKPSAPDSCTDPHAAVNPGAFMFPHIQGVFAFDTPFLGIAPGVVSYGAEGQFRNATAAYTALSEVAGLFGIGGSNNSSEETRTADRSGEPQKTLPTSPTNDAAATPSWQRWGRYAMFAGAGALAAGGAAAVYSQRQRLTDGWGWVSSHLVFVGCLARSSELRQRLASLVDVQKDRGISCVNFYTCLGENASSLVENTSRSNTSFSQKIIRSKDRTFCSLPAGGQGPGLPDLGLRWVRAVNDKAADEIKAHTSMFLQTENPGYALLLREASRALVESVDQGWYATATGSVEEVDGDMPHHKRDALHDPSDDGFMDGDDVVVVE
ncbi:uncharacterized protein BP01DRAFT_338932 [Aspergillus saccharolyticus JOP 1030-1]|uniref:DUF676 domain-containing protein n=1 Tax=Aspergillus saccharolyticus JOP 1030-1 TaxID=1450539 RepID=A0A319AIA1_9EURO|nr:hypothetical protein BP01DRAFT_338932 [Aspergillus saccharolyticus JOP 1030-1]PYH46352.1 hypothetical protein BP01DRAFT_338932 [Aspergillus saccharolyticus JOP 1030-1]